MEVKALTAMPGRERNSPCPPAGGGIAGFLLEFARRRLTRFAGPRHRGNVDRMTREFEAGQAKGHGSVRPAARAAILSVICGGDDAWRRCCRGRHILQRPRRLQPSMNLPPHIGSSGALGVRGQVQQDQ